MLGTASALPVMRARSAMMGDDYLGPDARIAINARGAKSWMMARITPPHGPRENDSISLLCMA